MPRGTRFVKNESGIVELLQSDAIRAELRAPAEHVLATAQANAPVESGEYRASLHIEEGTDGDRAYVAVGSDAPHALIVEANTGNLVRALGG